MMNSLVYAHFAMLRRLGVLFHCLFLVGTLWRPTSGAFAVETNDTCLWYAQPAKVWNDALPIGNGRLGAMVFGGISDERIQFNEDTLWTGRPHDYVRAGAREQLPEIRRLLAEGKSKDAALLAREKFLSDPVRQKAYQPFGDLRLHFTGHDNAVDYRRELDLDSAIASTTYRVDEVTYRREAFASYPDQVIVLRLTADHRGSISFTLRMDSPHTDSQTRVLEPDTLALTGQVEPDGLRFESRVKVVSDGGRVVTRDNSLSVENANSVTLLLTAATSFKNFQDISADPARRCGQDLAAVGRKNIETILADHLADHRRLFRRVTLNLGRTAAADLPTDDRLRRLKTAGLESDPALVALHFQYGRYLLIASSRAGSEPANLQGNWNELLDPPWESKYTLNINFEMNYWPAEVANLSECHEPLFDMIDDLIISGGRTAKEQYGCRGWVAASQHRPLARLRADQQHRRHLAHRRRVAVPASVGTLPVHRRQKISRRPRLPGHESRVALFRRFSHQGSEDRLARHVAVVLARTGNPDDRPDDGRTIDSRTDEPHHRGGADSRHRRRLRRSNLPASAINWPPTRSANTASSRNGSMTWMCPTTIIATCRRCWRCIPARKSRRPIRKYSPRPKCC